MRSCGSHIKYVTMGIKCLCTHWTGKDKTWNITDITGLVDCLKWEMLAYQAWIPEFKPQYHQNNKPEIIKKYLLYMIVQIFLMRKRETWWTGKWKNCAWRQYQVHSYTQGTNNNYEETDKCGLSVKKHYMSSSNCFWWKARTPYSVHELTKCRKKHGISPFSISLFTEPFTLQSPCNPLGI
jgi:hypothetical protein